MARTVRNSVLCMDKHQEIEVFIEERIRSGNWKLHEKLPPERQLALSLGVSRNTLRNALQILQGRGILGVRRGSGTFVQAVPGQGGSNTRQDFHARLAGMTALFPPVAALCARSAKLVELLDLESKLSQVGLAVHTGSAAEFARAQRLFLRSVAEWTHNVPVATAAGQLIPQGRFFSEALERAAKLEWEALFAELAGLLGGIRRGQPEEAGAHALRYAELLHRVCRFPEEPKAAPA